MKFMQNIRNAVKTVKHKYPSTSHTVCWIFDQSSCHRAYADDALNVKRMNIRPETQSGQIKHKN